MKKFVEIDLQLFADVDMNTQTTNTAGLSAEMKEFYSKDLIELMGPQLIHAQFGEKKALPKGSGKRISWRRWSNFKKALKPIEEGVTPKGSAIQVGEIVKEVEQFGDFSTITDVLDLTAVDDVIVEHTSKHADNAAVTLDTIVRNELHTGTMVFYAPNVTVDENGKETVTEVTSRAGLTKNAKLTPAVVLRAATILKKNNAPKIGDSYVAIVHSSVAGDLMGCKGWIDIHQYKNPENIFEGEIGKLYGVRFVETTEAAIFCGANLTADSRSIKASAINGNVVTISAISAEDAEALAGREILLWSGSAYEKAEVVSATTTSITLSEAAELTTVKTIYPGEGGKETDEEKCAVYGCLFLGKGAYGTVDLEGGGLEVLVKGKESGGTSNPLELFSTVGWKCTGYGAKILIPEYILRVECGSSFSNVDDAN